MHDQEILIRARSVTNNAQYLVHALKCTVNQLALCSVLDLSNHKNMIETCKKEFLVITLARKKCPKLHSTTLL